MDATTRDSSKSSEMTFEDVRRRVGEAIRQEPGTMTSLLARELGVPEEEVIRALPAGQVVELNAARWEELVHRFEQCGRVHVIVSNAGATLECLGEFGGLSRRGGYVNVRTPSLDMHVRADAVASVFAVERPNHFNGKTATSFQFYDHQGLAAFKVYLSFGAKNEPTERQAMFDQLRQDFQLTDSPVPAGGEVVGHDLVQ